MVSLPEFAPNDIVVKMGSMVPLPESSPKSKGKIVTIGTSTSSVLVAFDIGGSHISAALCSIVSAQVLRQERAPVPEQFNCAQFVDLLFSLTESLASENELKGAAIAVPGPFDFLHGISLMRHKLRSLYGVELRALLGERFGWDPGSICFLNDAAAFLLGEIESGAARGAGRAVGISLGTGIGSAFSENGQLVTDSLGIPPGGEIWNLPYANETIEDYLSARAIRQQYRARTGKDVEVDVIAAKIACDPDAAAVFETLGMHLGQMLRMVLAPFAPEIIVIGGGISRSAHLFLPHARRQLHGTELVLVPSSLLDQAPLIGATAFWRDHLLASRRPVNSESPRPHLDLFT